MNVIQTVPGSISLTFDDALHEHLDFVIPTLNGARLKGTFYTHLSSPAFMSRQNDWRQASVEGHELGNHTVFHPADSRKAWVQPGNAIDEYSLDRMRRELEFASAWLSALDGRTERTFAYPCSNSFVGCRGNVRRAVDWLGCGRTRVAGWVDRWKLDWGNTLQSYEPIVSELFIAGRGGGLTLGQPVPPTSSWSSSQLPSVAVVDWSPQDLIRHVTTAVESHTWAILQFHGIGGGHAMDCPRHVFLDFVLWLKSNHAHRVITVAEGARRLWHQRSQATSNTAGSRPVAKLSAELHSQSTGINQTPTEISRHNRQVQTALEK